MYGDKTSKPIMLLWLKKLFLKWDELGIPPTRRDLKGVLGSSTCTITYRLLVLESAGYITIIPQVARGITLTQRGKAKWNELAGNQPAK